MVHHKVTRTLVKSQPEVWAQCSEADSLGRHLSGTFGEIRITRLEPEHAVAWEGEQVSGTVKIEPSAWGTRVTMAVQLEEGSEPSAGGPDTSAPAAEISPLIEATEPVEPTAPAEESAPAESPPPAPPVRRTPPRPRTGLSRWWDRFRRPAATADPAKAERTDTGEAPEPNVEPPQPVLEPTPLADAEPAPPAEIEPAPEESPSTPAAEAALQAALESLGQAHHRPYSRA